MPIKKWRPLEVWSFLLFWTDLLSLQGHLEERAYFRAYTSPLPYKFLLIDGQQKWQRHKQISTKDIYIVFQIWTLKEGFLILGKEINSASRSTVKEVKVLINARSIYLPCHHKQKVPKQKAQRASEGILFPIPGHWPRQWELGPDWISVGPPNLSKTGSPNITNTTSWYVKAVYCLLH